MGQSSKMRGMVLLGALLVIARLAGAEWKEPADKTFTEDQLNTYIATTDDWLDENAKISQSLNNATTTAERIALVGELGKKHQACLDRHTIGSDEYNWLGQRTIEAYGVAAYAEEGYAKAESDMQAKLTENDAKMADAQSRLAEYQQAEQAGQRVMTPEDREAAVKQAKSDQQAALDEAKQHDDEANAAENDANQHDADAKAADDLASEPPADVVAGDRPSYIDGKKTEAQAARDAAKEARGREADAEKAKADAIAKAASAAQTIEHPDIPQTDDEKASVKSDNDAAIIQAQADIVQSKQNKESMALVEAQLKQSLDKMEQDIPQQNIALMRKHLAEYQQMFQRSANGGATTQPAH